MTHDSFDAGRDAALGRLIREHLDPGAHEAFAARVVAAAWAERAQASRHQRRGTGTWELLAQWIGPGVAAAALLTTGALIGVGVADRTAEPESVAELVSPAEAPAGLLQTDARPSPEILVASFGETR